MFFKIAFVALCICVILRLSFIIDAYSLLITDSIAVAFVAGCSGYAARKVVYGS